MYKLMIVEDEYYIRKGIVSLIDYESINCTVIAEAENGADAFEILKNKKIDIVITDIKMPIMSGLELVELCKDLEVAFIILSGYNEFNFAQEALHLGASSYILKPVEKSELVNVIGKAKEDLKLIKLSNKVINDQKLITNINLLKMIDLRENDEIVEAMIDYVRDNYSEKFNMSDLSKKLNYSESTLNNRFRNIMDTSFNTFVNKYRIQQAINMLESGFDPIDVYSKVGYSEYKYFSRVFKKNIKVSPSTFKKMIEQ